jgi:hypothetical protein
MLSGVLNSVVMQMFFPGWGDPEKLGERGHLIGCPRLDCKTFLKRDSTALMPTINCLALWRICYAL